MTYRELLAACDRIGLYVGLELRGATSKTVDGGYRQVLKVRTRRSGELLAQASLPAGASHDELAGELTPALAAKGVPV